MQTVRRDYVKTIMLTADKYANQSAKWIGPNVAARVFPCLCSAWSFLWCRNRSERKLMEMEYFKERERKEVMSGSILEATQL